MAEETIKADTVKALNNALELAMQKDEKILVMGEDVGADGGVFRVTEGLKKKYKDRIIDTPLSESGIAGSAIGLCLAGWRPVAEIQFSGFLPPAFDQIISHASRFRNRTRGAYNIPLTIRTPMGGAVGALEHHSESTESCYAHIPGLKVVMCSRPYNAKGLLLSAIADEDPVLFYEPKKIYRSIKEDIPKKPYKIEIGKANTVKTGSDMTIVTYGAMVKEVLEVVLQMKETSAEVIDLQTLYPLDMETIQKSAEKTGKLAVVNEARGFLNLSSEIIARVLEQNNKIKAKSITAPDTIVPLPRLEDYYIPTKKRIYEELKRW